KQMTSDQYKNTKILRIIRYPIHKLATLVVKLYCFVSGSVIDEDSKESHIQSGYIEGTVKLLAMLCNIAILKLIPKEYKMGLCFILSSISFSFFYFLTKCESFNLSLILYFISLTFIVATESIAKGFLHES